MKNQNIIIKNVRNLKAWKLRIEYKCNIKYWMFIKIIFQQNKRERKDSFGLLEEKP